MCGIAGIINLNETKNLSHKLIVDMCDAQKHRGPDGEGYLFTSDFSFEEYEQLKSQRPKAHLHIVDSERAVMLGHRRLSIIDLNNNAYQPMPDSEEKIWVVFNGEIYNHRGIRIELELLGYKFNTDHSDTEVLLNAYKAWGVECLEKFKGMFAFVLWDKPNDTFFVVRDRLGVKPLHFTINNNNFYFSSEIKGILQNPKIDRKINYHALNEFLTFSSVAAPNTMFTGIYKMKPAHYLLIKNGVVGSQQLYWDLAEKATHKLNLSESETINVLQEKLLQAIDRRREGDVPYGALLSGGVDSSANVAILSKLINTQLKTFTVGFKNVKGVYNNEFLYAEQIAKLFDTKHYEINLDENNFYDFLNKMSLHLDEPLADTACIPIYYVAELAKQNGVSILLGGEGSDELFIGYQLWRFNNDFHNLFGTRNSNLLANLTENVLKLPFIKNKRKFYKNWISKIKKNQTTFWGGTELLSDEQKQNIFTDSFREKTKDFDSYLNIKVLFERFTNAGNTDYLNWMSYLDTNIRLPELLLARLDKMTMAASVEAREPFMDFELAEFALQMNSSFKVKNKTEKYILKKALETILPNNIIYRPKDGFTVPLQQMFANEKLRKFALNKINEFNTFEKIFESDYIHKIFESNSYNEIWLLLNLSLWWDNYIVNYPMFINENGAIVAEFKI